MKFLFRYITLILIFSFSEFQGQNYSPFYYNRPSRFENIDDNRSDDAYYYAIDSFSILDTLVIDQYKMHKDQYVNVINTHCQGWGGVEQPKQETGWIGRKIKINQATDELIIENRKIGSVKFDFSLSINDTSIIYEDQFEVLKMTYQGKSQLNILGSVIDSVKHFKLIHEDYLGNSYHSRLDGYEIILSKNIGLLQFFDVYEFPLITERYELKGILKPNLGYYQFTYDEMYPWQLGDTLQYKTENGNYNTGTSYAYYTYWVTSRIESSDSVWIYLDSSRYYDVPVYPDYAPPPPSVNHFSLPNPIVYRKGKSFLDKPIDMVEEVNGVRFTSVFDDECAGELGYSSNYEYLTYCDSCDCWTNIDGSGSSFVNYSYRKGLGCTKMIVRPYSYLVNQYSNVRSVDLIYSNVDAFVCGSRFYPPLEDNVLEEDTTETPTFVNPFHKPVSKFYDLLGREVEYKPNKPLLILYEDGTVEKRIIVNN